MLENIIPWPYGYADRKWSYKDSLFDSDLTDDVTDCNKIATDSLKYQS